MNTQLFLQTASSLVNIAMPNTAGKHHGFQLAIPIQTRQLISPIRILPAHLIGEQVTPYSGNFNALWDTGATGSTISDDVAAHFKLPIIGESYAHGAGGVYKTKRYLAGLILPNNVIIPQLLLSGFVGSDQFHMLIGMDIISLGDFLVSTANGHMHFSFQLPSAGGFYLQGIKKAACADGNFIERDDTVRRNTPKVGKNDLCPCQSGKKFKKCCGKYQ